MAQQLGFEPPPILMERPVPEEMLPLDEDLERGPAEGPRKRVKQRVDAMRVHEVLARRPLEDREAAVLRRHQRHRVALIVDELRGREVPRAAELRRRRPPPARRAAPARCAIFAPNASSS